MPASPQVRSLKSRGFDRSYKIRGEPYTRVKCSQCEALFINGVASHETGCPNQRKAAKR
jgi:hypothetical protein